MPDVRTHDAIEERDAALRRLAEVERENLLMREALTEIAVHRPRDPISIFFSHKPREIAFRVLARIDNPETC